MALEFRQLGDIDGYAPRLVAGQQVCRRAASRLILEIDVGERLPIGIADDEAGVGLLGGPGRREAARRHRQPQISAPISTLIPPNSHAPAASMAAMI